MGYIYETMNRAKEAIQNSFKENVDKYKEIFAIIDVDGSVNSIIHCLQQVIF